MGRIIIETDKPVAFDSPDHIQPCGTADNNTVKPRFNRKLFRYLPPAEVRMLDIGCAGGGLVKSIIDDGGFAVGIEGSDYSRKFKRAEWATIPDRLFTADATVPFQLFEEQADGSRTPLLFNVITAWEFLEHIAEDKLAGVTENILRHLAPHGFFLASIALFEHEFNGVTLHQTVQQKSWWVEKFAKLGLSESQDLENYLHYDWVRGEPDWNRSEYPSFPIALVRSGESLPYPSKLSALRRGNIPYEFLRTIYRRIKKGPMTQGVRKVMEETHA